MSCFLEFLTLSSSRFGLLVKPLQRMTTGGFLTALAFFLTGFLELEMQKTYEKIPALGEAHLHLMNNLPCNASIRLHHEDGGIISDHNIGSLANLVIESIEPNSSFILDLKVGESCLKDILTVRQANVKMTAMEKKVTPVLLGVEGGSVKPLVIAKHDEPKKDGSSNSRIRVIYELGDLDPKTNLTLVGDKSVTFMLDQSGAHGTEYSKLDIGDYE